MAEVYHKPGSYQVAKITKDVAKNFDGYLVENLGSKWLAVPSAMELAGFVHILWDIPGIPVHEKPELSGFRSYLFPNSFLSDDCFVMFAIPAGIRTPVVIVQRALPRTVQQTIDGTYPIQFNCFVGYSSPENLVAQMTGVPHCRGFIPWVLLMMIRAMERGEIIPGVNSTLRMVRPPENPVLEFDEL